MNQPIMFIEGIWNLSGDAVASNDTYDVQRDLSSTSFDRNLYFAEDIQASRWQIARPLVRTVVHSGDSWNYLVQRSYLQSDRD